MVHVDLVGPSVPLELCNDLTSFKLESWDDLNCWSFRMQQRIQVYLYLSFESWDCNDDLPFMQCFEWARQASLLRYSYSEDRDLFIVDDLYDNNVVTPAMIVVPCLRIKTVY